MATSRNPFELLQDDFEEKAAVAAVVVKETAPVKAPQNKTQKVAIQKDGAKKPIQKNLKKVQVKENNFEEEPSHKEEVQVKGSGPGTTDAKKRQFDRKSANGKQISSKKSHGKASWGEEVDGQTWTQEEIEEEQEKQRQEQELEQSYKSLQDYQKEKQGVKKDVAVRAPNEGVDDKQWKKLTEYVKKDDIEELFAGKTKEKERKLKEKPVKNVLVIEQTFAPVQRERSERSDRGGSTRGRGGERGGRGRGKPKDLAPGSGRGKKAVNVMDPNAFPSLVAN